MHFLRGSLLSIAFKSPHRCCLKHEWFPVCCTSCIFHGRVEWYSDRLSISNWWIFHGRVMNSFCNRFRLLYVMVFQDSCNILWSMVVVPDLFPEGTPSPSLSKQTILDYVTYFIDFSHYIKCITAQNNYLTVQLMQKVITRTAFWVDYFLGTLHRRWVFIIFFSPLFFMQGSANCKFSIFSSLAWPMFYKLFGWLNCILSIGWEPMIYGNLTI